MSAADQIDRIAELAAEGKNNTEIGLELGLSRHAIRRARRKHGIPASEADVTKAPVLPSRLERAERAAEGAQTDEDRLLDDIDHLRDDNRRMAAVIKKLRKETNRDEILARVVEDTTREHFSTPHLSLPPFRPAESSGTPQEFLAHISDLHYGEVVEPELALGVEYNPEVAQRRMSYLRDRIIRYADLRPYEISVLHLAYLGDMCSGMQHDDLDTTNARGMMDQALEVAEMCYQQVSDFETHFANVSVTFVSGNHGRVHKIPRHKARYENWDYLAGRILKQMSSMGLSDRVTMNVPRGVFEIIDVAGRRIALVHGDGVKAANFAGIPWYSMKSKRDAFQSMLRALGLPLVDQISMGHLHQHAHIPSDCNIVVNGSIKGGDEFIQATRYAHTPPLQIIQEWHPRHGLTCTDYITFSDDLGEA